MKRTSRNLFSILSVLCIALVCCASLMAQSQLPPPGVRSVDEPRGQTNADAHAGHAHAPGEGHEHEQVSGPARTMMSVPRTGEAAARSAEDAAFAAALNLKELRALSLQDRQTIKTWDTFARQAVAAIAGRSTVDGADPLFTVLDIAFRPDGYGNRNLLRIKNAPLRQDIAGMPGIEAGESKRILREGTVSLAFWLSGDVQAYLQRLQMEAVWKSEAIGQVQSGASLLNAMLRDGPSLATMAMIAPPAGSADGRWLAMPSVLGNVPRIAEAVKLQGAASAPVAGYDDAKINALFTAISRLQQAWKDRDAAVAQAQVDAVARILPTLSASYPSATKRHAEVLYNKLYKLTLPGAALYFVAFTLFVVSAYAASPGIRKWGVWFMAAGLVLHTIGIAVRWWLDQKSTGSWFYSIPIKNQFESVMMSAWFGLIIGFGLEVWRKRSLFGAAACFVGWMSLIALFTVPYVFGKDIGNEIGRVNGILMSYWLYIHVTLATASYALIGMSFLLGAWWLVRYLTAPAAVRGLSAQRLSADSVEDETRAGAFAFAFPKPALAGVSDDARQARFSEPAQGAMGGASTFTDGSGRSDLVPAFLARLDACNLVILQLAFWILGVAIICGAIWADVSWGRPWGWDPKETFALVTWMVYLVIIHVRLVTRNKALWTAVLTIIGFFVMLFNWIGVNYFLVGLHSYA